MDSCRSEESSCKKGSEMKEVASPRLPPPPRVTYFLLSTMAVTRPATHRSISHLLLSGHNPLSPPSTSQSSSALLSRQSPSNPSLSPIPFNTWLSQLGREVDTYPLQNYNQIHSISSSTGHSLICYRNSRGVDRVIGLGRNESGQLGIGFTSQEGTRGLVEGFEGESVLKVKTAVQASYLLVKEDDTR